MAEGQLGVQRKSWPTLSLKRLLGDGEPWTDVCSWIQLCHWPCSPSSRPSPPSSCSTEQHHLEQRIWGQDDAVDIAVKSTEDINGWLGHGDISSWHSPLPGEHLPWGWRITEGAKRELSEAAEGCWGRSASHAAGLVVFLWKKGIYTQKCSREASEEGNGIAGKAEGPTLGALLTVLSSEFPKTGSWEILDLRYQPV